MALVQGGIVQVAYKKLKQMTYYEKSHLFLRKHLAEFESGSDFLSRLETVQNVINAEEPTQTEQFQLWLKQITVQLLPKGWENPKPLNEDEGTYLTNVTTRPKYIATKVNYLFVGPVELHLIAVMWLMTEGYKLDEKLRPNCMGSRLHRLVGLPADNSANLFKKYHELYAKWRDDGINKARSMLTVEGRSVSIIALDLQEFFYRIEVDWKELRSEISLPLVNTSFEETMYGTETLGAKLFSCIEATCISHRERISSTLELTHDLPPGGTCLPIGLCASPVIANWYLNKFDSEILKNVRPAYYGRYVDDILLVIASEPLVTADPVREFMDQVLVQANVLKWDEVVKAYRLSCRPSLCLQKAKCILQFFDAKHSIAGLEKFQKEIEENASDFALLPVEGDDSPVEQVAYDLLYDGSVNKLRSVKEIAENRWELAKHLAKQTQLYLVANGARNRQITSELFRFFKGRNALEYWDMWERVIAFIVVTGTEKELAQFCKLLQSEIKRLHFKDSPQISILLRQMLSEHLELALAITTAIRDSTSDILLQEQNIWRTANLLRHHLVAIPLLNYTSFEGNLATPKLGGKFFLDEAKFQWSPRFVHYDECVGFVDSQFANFIENDSLSAANSLYERFHGAISPDIQSFDVASDVSGNEI